MPVIESQAVLSGKTKKLRVLLTGFGPFRAVTTNPSWLAVSKLNNQTLKFTSNNSSSIEAHISALEVPVTYTAVLSTVPPLHASKQYDLIVHVGVGLAGGLEIERQAHKTGYDQADAEGKLCPYADQKIKKRGFGAGFEEFGEVLKTKIDVDGVVAHLTSMDLEHVKPSNDPGRYLCDFIYFCSLACAERDGGRVKVLFMHVPPEGQPYAVEDMTKAVKGIIEYYALHS